MNNYQRSSQHQLVKPYLDRAARYDPEVNGDMVTYLSHQIHDAMSIRSEYEEIPVYVRQIDSYVKGSELSIALEVLNIVCHKIPEEYYKPEDVQGLMSVMELMADERDWPMEFFHQRMLIIMGIMVMDPEHDPSTIHLSTGKDYN